LVGIIYPVLEAYLYSLLSDKNVFCKFVGRCNPKVQVGDRVLFYCSGGSREAVGEATIIEMEYPEPNAVLPKNGDRLFITKDELTRYVSQRDRPEGKKCSYSS